MTDSDPKLSEREFVLRAIIALRKPDKLGMHTVWSNFNDAFREEFGRDPYQTVDWLVKEGLIVKSWAKKGSWLYLKADWEKEQQLKGDQMKKKRVSAALSKIYNGRADE